MVFPPSAKTGWPVRPAGAHRSRPGSAKRVVRGTLVDVDPGGAACVERPDGTREAVSAGEIVLGHANGLAQPPLRR